MRQPRHLNGTYAKSWKTVIKEFFSELFSKKTYYKLIITTLFFLASFISVYTMLEMTKQPIPIQYIYVEKTYSGTNYESNEKLEVLVGTKMEEAIPYIEKSAQYYNLPVSVYLGIAFAESSFNRFEDDCYNPWGIGNNGPVCYEDWKQGVDEFGRLIKYYYYSEGKFTPEQLLRKYVGWENPHWVNNVKEYYNPQIIIKFE